MIGMFPLLFVVVFIYAIVGMVVGGGSAAGMQEFLSVGLLGQSGIEMHEGEYWNITRGDVFLLVGLVLLFVEIIGSSKSDRRTIINHALSMLVFVGALLAFVLSSPFATSTFFFLMVMTLIDVVAGFIITIRVARRDIGFGGDIPGI